MAYTYRNKKTGEVIYLNRRVKSAFWEEETPEEEPFEDSTEDSVEEPAEEITKEPVEEITEEPAPKKATSRRGKK